MAYLWAAYRRGLFGDEFDADMPRDDFVADIAAKLEIIVRTGGQVDMLIGGMIPVAVVVSTLHMERLWPHVTWFPEASPRNKMELAVRFFAERRKDMVVLCRPEVAPFFQRVCHYGVLRPVGKFHNLYENAGDAMIYETV